MPKSSFKKKKKSFRNSPKKYGMAAHPTATTRAGQYRQVYEGKASKTFGGLTKNDLMENAKGKIVSIRASMAGKQRYQENGLAAYQY